MEYKQRNEELAIPPSADDDIAPKLKQSRRWKVMDSTFQWKMSLAIFLCLTMFIATPIPSSAAALDGTEVFFSNEKEVRVPVIMYHLVIENKRYHGRDGISPAELKNDLEYLKNNGYNTIVIQDLIDFVDRGKSLPKNPIVLTFDDGNSSDYKYLFPLLKEYEMKAVISIMGNVTDKITSQYDKNPKEKYPNLTWAQVQEMHESGMVEVQSHGYDVHGKAGSGKQKRESDAAYHQRLKADLQKLQDLCQQHLGAEPTTFCYPYGIISKGSHAVLEEMGFAASLSCQEGINIIKQGDKACLLKLNRVNRASGRAVSGILEGLEKK